MYEKRSNVEKKRRSVIRTAVSRKYWVVKNGVGVVGLFEFGA